MGSVIWRLRDVGLGLGACPRVCGVDLDIPLGTTALLGPSGAGKSSLLNVLVGFEIPDQGTVTREMAVPEPELAVFWVPQRHGLWPGTSVSEHLRLSSPRVVSDDHLQRLLEQLGLGSRSEATPSELSQGERGRLAVARGIAADPAVLVMDEPFSSVNRALGRRCWRVVDDWRRRRSASLVFATHSSGAVLEYAEHVLCMADGSVVYSGRTEELYWNPPSAAIGGMLGELNWFGPMEARRWLGADSEDPVGFRPALLGFNRGTGGRHSVACIRFRGNVTDVELTDGDSGERRLVCVPSAMDLPVNGERVTLVVKDKHPASDPPASTCRCT